MVNGVEQISDTKQFTRVATQQDVRNVIIAQNLDFPQRSDPRGGSFKILRAQRVDGLLKVERALIRQGLDPQIVSSEITPQERAKAQRGSLASQVAAKAGALKRAEAVKRKRELAPTDPRKVKQAQIVKLNKQIQQAKKRGDVAKVQSLESRKQVITAEKPSVRRQDRIVLQTLQKQREEREAFQTRATQIASKLKFTSAEEARTAGFIVQERREPISVLRTTPTKSPRDLPFITRLRPDIEPRTLGIVTRGKIPISEVKAVGKKILSGLDVLIVSGKDLKIPEPLKQKDGKPGVSSRLFDRDSTSTISSLFNGKVDLQESKVKTTLKKTTRQKPRELKFITTLDPDIESRTPALTTKARGQFLERQSQIFKLKSFEFQRKKFSPEGVTIPEKLFETGRGTLTSLVGTGLFVKGLITKPGKTIPETGASLLKIGGKLVTGKGFPEIGQALRQRSEFSVGFIGAEVFTAKGLGRVKPPKVSAVTFSKFITSDILPSSLPIVAGTAVAPVAPLLQSAPIALFLGKKKGKIKGRTFLDKGEVGIRLRSPGLKQRGVKEQIIAVTSKGQLRVTEKGLAPRRAGLTQIAQRKDVQQFVSKRGERIFRFPSGAKTFIESGTQQKKFRKTFGQATSQARQAGKRIQEILSSGKGTILVQQSRQIQGFKKLEQKFPLRSKETGKITGFITKETGLKLGLKFREVKKAKPVQFKIQKPLEKLRAGFRPGMRERLIRRIQEAQSQRLLQQELGQPKGAFPTFETPSILNEILNPKKKKLKIFVDEQGLVFQRTPTEALNLRSRVLQSQSLIAGAKVRSRIIPILSSKTVTGLGQTSLSKAKLGQPQVSVPATAIIAGVIPIIGVDLSQRQATALDQLTIPKLKTDFVTPIDPIPSTTGTTTGFPRIPRRPIPIIPTPTPSGRPPPFRPKEEPKKTPPPKKPIIIIKPKEDEGAVQKTAHIIEVREGTTKSDRFVKTNDRPLPLNKARNRGAFIADNTTARSFRTKPTSSLTTIKDDSSFKNRDKFRRPRGKTKLSRNTFVEKSKFAIDSPGELAGIPFSPQRIISLRRNVTRRKALAELKIRNKKNIPKRKKKRRTIMRFL